MPELPDVEVYRAALEPRILERTLLNVRIGSPFLVRSAQPPIADTFGHRVQAIRRVGKRLAIGIDNGLWLVLHLMIAGRLHWKLRSPNLSNRRQLAVFDFESGSLLLTEAGTQRRASLYIVRNLADVDPGGIEVFDASPAEFARRLAEENHTLKRALTDPRVFSGIGNAYSDEILHRARLSPIAMTQKLTGEEITRLHDAARETLKDWTERLLAEYGEALAVVAVPQIERYVCRVWVRRTESLQYAYGAIARVRWLAPFRVTDRSRRPRALDAALLDHPRNICRAPRCFVGCRPVRGRAEIFQDSGVMFNSLDLGLPDLAKRNRHPRQVHC